MKKSFLLQIYVLFLSNLNLLIFSETIKSNDKPIIGILSMPIMKDSQYSSDEFSFINYSYKVDLEASGLLLFLFIIEFLKK